MGRTSKPVRFLVLDADLAASPEFQALVEQGHMVDTPLDEHQAFVVGSYDVVCGRRAWYLDMKHMKYLDIAIKNARKRADYRAAEAKKKDA